MGKVNKGKKDKQEKQEEVKILNVASEDEVVVIDTSALDKELESADGASLVIPITGGMSDKSSKKDKGESKKDKDEKVSSITETFSKFLKNEADASEIKDVSIDKIKEMLESQNLVELGKFILEHPEVMQAFIKSSKNVKEDETPEYKEEKVEDKMEEEDMNGTLVRIELNKKARKNLRETLADAMEKIDASIPVKPLFKVIEEELEINVAKIVNKLIDNLDNYDEDKFNAFIAKTVKKLENSKLNDVIKVLTGETISHLINLLFSNEQEAMNDVLTTFEYRLEKIVKLSGIEEMDEKDFKNVDDMIVAAMKKVIQEILRQADERKATEQKCEEPKFGSFGLLGKIMSDIASDSKTNTKSDKDVKSIVDNKFASSVYNTGRQIYKSIFC